MRSCISQASIDWHFQLSDPKLWISMVNMSNNWKVTYVFISLKYLVVKFNMNCGWWQFANHELSCTSIGLSLVFQEMPCGSRSVKKKKKSPFLTWRRIYIWIWWSLNTYCGKSGNWFWANNRMQMNALTQKWKDLVLRCQWVENDALHLKALETISINLMGLNDVR